MAVMANGEEVLVPIQVPGAGSVVFLRMGFMRCLFFCLWADPGMDLMFCGDSCPLGSKTEP